MRKILVASDSFKGTMSSSEIGSIFQNKMKFTSYVPIADGGEGSIETLKYTMDELESIQFKGKDVYGNDLKQLYFVQDNTAYIETAQICGIEKQNEVLRSTSEGIGLALKDASLRGITEVYIFLGGTGVNDGGLGILKGLGFSLTDKEGKEIVANTQNLGKLYKIQDPQDMIKFKKIILVSDVKNPLLGNLGATKIYGPQKGVTDGLMSRIEQDMITYVSVIKRHFQSDKSKDKSSGAAGGISYILMTLFKCEVISGIEYISGILNLRNLIKNSELIITGEGKIDNQSFYGKAIQHIIEICQDFQVPYVLICGKNTLKKYDDELCKGIFQLLDVAKNENESILDPVTVLNRLIDKKILPMLIDGTENI